VLTAAWPRKLVLIWVFDIGITRPSSCLAAALRAARGETTLALLAQQWRPHCLWSIAWKRRLREHTAARRGMQRLSCMSPEERQPFDPAHSTFAAHEQPSQASLRHSYPGATHSEEVQVELGSSIIINGSINEASAG